MEREAETRAVLGDRERDHRSKVLMNSLFRNRKPIPPLSHPGPVITHPPQPSCCGFFHFSCRLRLHVWLHLYLPHISFCPSSLLFLVIVCHLCDQWSSFFPGNSSVMDFALLHCLWFSSPFTWARPIGLLLNSWPRNICLSPKKKKNPKKTPKLFFKFYFSWTRCLAFNGGNDSIFLWLMVVHCSGRNRVKAAITARRSEVFILEKAVATNVPSEVRGDGWRRRFLLTLNEVMQQDTWEETANESGGVF